ncbi:MAG: glycosyltransferase family 4 protein [Planctomycetota bacterium]
MSVEHGSSASDRLRVAYLAAGAAGMYCGSCLRDNRVAASLLSMGRDVVLIPLYTPLTTDERDVSREPIYYGGINVFLQQRFRLFRALPGWLGRVLDTPAILRRVVRWSSEVKPEDLGALTVSVLRGEHGAQRRELQKLIDGLRVIRPDIVHLPNLPFLGVARAIKAALRVPVVCTLSGEDIFLDALQEPYRTTAFDLIREAAAQVDAFVAVTRYYAGHAAGHFSLPGDRIHVVPMGVRVEDFEGEPMASNEPFNIGCLARICPAKGLHQLCEAVVRLRTGQTARGVDSARADTGESMPLAGTGRQAAGGAPARDCRVLAAGHLSPADRPYLERIKTDLARAGHADALHYLGEVSREEKVRLLRSIQVLSVPTVYHEAKGLYVLEALAAGVPVVQPNHGSFPELIEATGGGLLYDPTGKDPVGALAEAIARLMDDPGERRRLGERGRSVVRARFSDRIMAEETWRVYERLCRA